MSSPFLRSSIWKDFFFASFQWQGKTEIYALSWNEYDVSDRCFDMNKKSKKKIQCQFGFDIRLIQWLEIDTMTRNCYNDSKLLQWLEIATMTRNRYNDSKLLQWLEIATMTRNCYNNSKLIQWLKVDRPTMTRNWYDVMALIQCFEFDIISCSFADLISKAESFCRRIRLHVITCFRTS